MSMQIMNWPVCGTTTRNCIEGPWGPALWERRRPYQQGSPRAGPSRQGMGLRRGTIRQAGLFRALAELQQGQGA